MISRSINRIIRNSSHLLKKRNYLIPKRVRCTYSQMKNDIKENESESRKDQDVFSFNTSSNISLKSKVPHISIEDFVVNNHADLQTCKDLVAALRDYGCVAIKDPRVRSNSNSEFVEMMAEYFNSRSQMLDSGEKLKEMFPEYGYETGVTPEFTERARDHQDTIAQLAPEHRPLTPQPPPKDSKWRYMYKIGERKDSEEFAMPLVVPEDVPQFKSLADEWSNSMLQTVFSVVEMLAIGLDMERDAFLKIMKRGAHILGPTGSDMRKFDVDTVFAGFHYDFCFMTIHGKSNYPGLYIWLKDGSKLPVVLDDGYLLIQSGLELEMYTGGLIKAGLHEVMLTQKAKEMYIEREKQGIKNGNWRVSSTVFSHVEHDEVIQPLPPFDTPEALEKYPPMTGLELMKRELESTDML